MVTEPFITEHVAMLALLHHVNPTLGLCTKLLADEPCAMRALCGRHACAMGELWKLEEVGFDAKKLNHALTVYSTDDAVLILVGPPKQSQGCINAACDG